MMKLIKMNNLVFLKWRYCALNLQGEGEGYLVFNVSFFSLKNKIQKHALLLLINQRKRKHTTTFSHHSCYVLVSDVSQKLTDGSC